MIKYIFLTVVLFWGSVSAGDFRWWPEQKMPRGLVTVDTSAMPKVAEPNGKIAPARNMGPEHMLAQSLAGLAAQAVNEGRGDELVYVNLWDNADYVLWRRMILERTGMEDRGTSTVWALVEKYAAQNIVKGYILYSWDFSEGEITTRRDGSDESCNVAASLAGVFGGVMVSEGQEAQAKALGLSLLADVRGKTEQWVFDNYKEQFNPNLVLLQDPAVPNNRAIAIAHRCLSVYGMEEPTEQIYQWMNKPGLVFGWNDGREEGRAVSQLSKYGHMIVPSNWALNMPVLSLAAGCADDISFNAVDPRTIDFENKSPAVSFYMSDGDNVQWMFGNFAQHSYYWGSPLNGRIPLGWGMPFADLMQVGVDVGRYLSRTQPEDTSVVLMPGYFFPDELGIALDKEERMRILKLYSKRIEHYLQRAGTGLFSFLSRNYDSAAALEAYSVFAKEIPSLTGMMVIDYAPYEKGDGKIFWFPNADGIDIPVVSAKYSLWANQNHARSGTPAKIARLINTDSAAAAKNDEPFFAWTIIHAWSGFRENPGDDETAENGKYGTDHAGVAPALWSANRLNESVNVVTPDELVWRIRMAYRPEQTKKILN